MTPFADTFEAAARRHRNVLLAAPAIGLILGFLGGPRLGPPEVLAAAGIFLGSFVTLTICAKVVGDSFHALGGYEGPGALRGTYVQHLVHAAALSWLARALLALTLAPFHVGAGAPTWVIFDPILLGLPLDALLVTVAITLNAVFGRGGTALGWVFVFLVGTLTRDAAIAPDLFGASGPLLRIIGFPWLELRGVPEALSTGDWPLFALGTVKVLAYWAVWVALGIGALTYRLRRAGRRSGGRRRPAPSRT